MAAALDRKETGPRNIPLVTHAHAHLREERSFMSVRATVRLPSATRMMRSTSACVRTGSNTRSDTSLRPHSPCTILYDRPSRSRSPHSRSWMCSW
jgi:hypothetical protein